VTRFPGVPTELPIYMAPPWMQTRRGDSCLKSPRNPPGKTADTDHDLEGLCSRYGDIFSRGLLLRRDRRTLSHPVQHQVLPLLVLCFSFC